MICLFRGGIPVLSIEDYIASRKKKDKLDEFNFKNHSVNMGTVIQYVMDYFNQYLNIEDYSYEQIKMQQAVDKFKAGLMERYPTSYEFIVSYYDVGVTQEDWYQAMDYNHLTLK